MPDPSDIVFSAQVAEVYQRLLVPLIFEPYAVDLTERLVGQDEGAILEVAAGTGVVTRLLATTLPATVSITATDLNPGMLAEAERVGTSRPVAFEQADVMALPYEAAAFDAAVCQFGVMFFPDKAKAFGELHRVLRPGGRLLFNVWDRIEVNEFADIVTEALVGLLASEQPRFLVRVPHGYFDADAIRDDLRAGGFDSSVEIESREDRSRAATARDVATAFCQGTPLRDVIESLAPGRLEEATEVATDAIEARFGPTDVDGLIRAWVVSADK